MARVLVRIIAPSAAALLLSVAVSQAQDAPRSIAFESFLSSLRAHVDATVNPGLEAEYRSFLERHGFAAKDVPYLKYRRMRLVYEATRDGGFWNTLWRITDEEPSSKKIWRQWLSHPGELAATGECDEISALTAFLGHRLGAGPVGLFWPTQNHTIVAWEPVPHGPRILLPTTQIFLDCREGFDNVRFSPAVQRVVYDYAANDLPRDTAMPTELADVLLDRMKAYGSASIAAWELLRYHRHHRQASSTSGCDEERRRLVEVLRVSHTEADQAALSAYAAEELGIGQGVPFDTLLTRLESLNP